MWSGRRHGDDAGVPMRKRERSNTIKKTRARRNSSVARVHTEREMVDIVMIRDSERGAMPLAKRKKTLSNAREGERGREAEIEEERMNKTNKSATRTTTKRPAVSKRR